MGEYLPLFGTAVLLAFLGTAVVQDVTTQRISNRLCLALFATGLLFALASGPALLAERLMGAGLGFGVFLLFYLARGMGAGDVKLMGAVGAHLGAATGVALVATLVLGGALAILFSLAVRYLPVNASLTGALALDGKGRLGFPYALAIAGGTLVALVAGAN